MFWDYFTFALVLLLGLATIIWPDEMAEFHWTVRHVIDEEGRKTVKNSIRVFGILVVLGCFIWLTYQFN